MKILKYKKMSKGRYKITFDKTELILYEDVIIKNRLLLNKEITLTLLNKVIEENKYYEIYNQCLSLIETKLRTKNELINNLSKKGYNKELINKVIDELTKKGILDEEKYILAYINDKVNLTSDGPYKIKRALIDLELEENLINKYLDSIDAEIWSNKIEKIINKRMNRMKDKSLNIIKNKLRIDLFNLGYDNNLIEDMINNIKKNDTEALEKDYQKAYNKYKEKYKEEQIVYIKAYLYRKGYDLENINDILNNKEGN